MIRLYEEIVGRGGVSPAYFFDNMDFAECAVFLKGLKLRERAELEKTRLIMWAAIQPHCKRRYGLDDILNLSDDSTDETSSTVSQRELEEIRERAKMFEK